MGAAGKTPFQRFVAKVERPNAEACWTWTGAIEKTGYGRFYDGNKAVLAHRWSYEFWVAPIAAGLQIDHLCRNRACVNPKHLQAVSQLVNILRGEGITAVNAEKTHCDRGGHEFTPENTYVRTRNGRPWRECWTCRREINREYKRRKRAEAKAYAEELDVLAPALARINSG